MELTRDEMVRYLEEINNRLAAIGESGEIVMLGGAVVSLVHGERGSTKDIDATYWPKEAIQEIINDMAQEYDLADDWMNNDAEGFLTSTMPYELFLDLPNLKVYNMDNESMLALKCASARAAPSPDMAADISQNILFFFLITNNPPLALEI